MRNKSNELIFLKIINASHTFFFIAIVLNEYYQYCIFSINYYLSLCVSQFFFQNSVRLHWFTWNLVHLELYPKNNSK